MAPDEEELGWNSQTQRSRNLLTAIFNVIQYTCCNHICYLIDTKNYCTDVKWWANYEDISLSTTAFIISKYIFKKSIKMLLKVHYSQGSVFHQCERITCTLHQSWIWGLDINLLPCSLNPHGVTSENLPTISNMVPPTVLRNSVWRGLENSQYFTVFNWPYWSLVMVSPVTCWCCGKPLNHGFSGAEEGHRRMDVPGPASKRCVHLGHSST